jgi:hypothetical protein
MDATGSERDASGWERDELGPKKDASKLQLAAAAGSAL